MNRHILALLFLSSHVLAGMIPEIDLLPVAQGLRQPVHAAPVGRGNDLIVVEQKGLLRLVTGDGRVGETLLDIRDRVESGGEKGLLAVALHPRFAANGRLFVNYTTRKGDQLGTHVSEFKADPKTLRVAPDSERILLAFDQPFANHNGGQIVFGPDGMLYIGVGDGGSANDPQDNGQRLDTWLGKILRIEVGEEPGTYRTPGDNPLADLADAKPEIYAYGLRNPWRFSFDRGTRRLFCGDVGQNHREEIDIIVPGGNYGWRVMEGNICTPRVNPDCETNGYLRPLIDYPRDEGVSVTGGFVYRGRKHPSINGVYFYADFASGNIWGLREAGGRVTDHRLVLRKGPQVASFAEDRDGEILVIDYGGRILRLAPRR